MANTAHIGHKPVVCFDMALNDLKAIRVRPSSAVSGAGRALSGVLTKEGYARIFFMREPFVNRSLVQCERLADRLSRVEGRKVFAISLYDSLFEDTQKEVELLRQYFPDSVIILGGPSVNMAKSLKILADFFPEADALVRGDGEPVFAPLVRAFSFPSPDREVLSKLTGVYVRDKEFEYYEERPNLLNTQTLNAQPGITAYPALIEDIKRKGSLDISTSRDCRYRCVFCSHKYHPVPIYWSAERVIQELHRIREMVKTGALPKEALSLDFIDDDFFQDHKRAGAFLDMAISDAEIRDHFKFQFNATVGSFYDHKILRADIIDKLALLNAGLKIGVDGLHNEALKYFVKGHSLDKAVNLMDALARKKIMVLSYAILTFPEISYDTLLETLSNMLKYLFRFSPFLTFAINPFLMAFESNGLRAKAVDCSEVVSRGGHKKLLPQALELHEKDLNRSFIEGLEIKMSVDRVISCAKIFNIGKDDGQISANFDFAKRLCGLLGEITVLQALGSGSPYLEGLALGMMIKKLKIDRALL